MDLRRIFIALAILSFVSFAQVIKPITSSQSLFWQQYNPQKCCTDETIKVFGQATIQANPDSASLSAQATANGASVNEAVSSLAKKVTAIIGVLKQSGLDSSNY